MYFSCIIENTSIKLTFCTCIAIIGNNKKRLIKKENLLCDLKKKYGTLISKSNINIKKNHIK